MLEENYYKAKRVSNTLLGKIDPTIGGSPLKFLSADEELDYKSGLAKGSYLHVKGIEGQSLIEVNPPSKDIKETIEVLYEMYPDMLSFDWESDSFKDRILEAFEESGKYSTYKPQTRIDKLRPHITYYNFLRDSRGKIIIKQDDAEKVYGMHEEIKDKLNYYNLIEGKNHLVFRELPIYYNIEVDVKAYGSDDYIPFTIPCKSKLDILHIDLERKIVELPDLKSFNKFISNYPKEFYYRRHYRQLAMYGIAAKDYMRRELGLNPDEFTFQYSIIAVMNEKPFYSDQFVASIDWIKYGENEVMSLLSRVGYHMMNDLWAKSMEHYEEGNFIDFNPEQYGIQANESSEESD